jgi:hypothetical protein
MYRLLSQAIVLFLKCTIIGAVALPLANHTEPDYKLLRRDNCGFKGNPDLYGLGIQLGVYFQLLSSWLANYYHPEILKDAWDTVSPLRRYDHRKRGAY